MRLYSTRNLNETLLPKEAIIKGLASDGGLYSPKYEDIVSNKFDIKDLLSNDYKKTAKQIFSIFLCDFTEDEIMTCINNAYSKSNFNEYENTVAPVTKIGDNFLMELYHGPTSAFKDVALTILPHFLVTSYANQNENKKIYILTATSGDTGKAALSGFKNVPNVFITVFYPTDGVSNIQKLQMQTSEGDNVSVVAIKGDFDDCQRLVKEIYTDSEIKKICIDNDVVLSSANSINIGRLIPQITYYVQTYIDLVNNNQIKLYDKLNFVVPTGNFGDILAGFIAKLLGTPIDKLICASNDNNILTDFINTGIYDKNRELYKTISPSMDILVSSNLERLLFLLSGNNDKLIKKLMTELNTVGKYSVDNSILNKIRENFVAYYASEEECKNTIKEAFENDKRIIDTHTAVAYSCLKKYKLTLPATGAGSVHLHPYDIGDAGSLKLRPYDIGECATVGVSTASVGANACGAHIILSTASPYKFARDVLSCIVDTKTDNLNDFDCLNKLHEITNEKIPTNLSELKDKPIRFDLKLSYEDGKKYVIEKIKSSLSERG